MMVNRAWFSVVVESTYVVTENAKLFWHEAWYGQHKGGSTALIISSSIPDFLLVT